MDTNSSSTNSSSTNSTSGGFEGGVPPKPTNAFDTWVAAAILIATVVAVVLGGLYVWMTNKGSKVKLTLSALAAGSSSTFEPPAERGQYIDARPKLDPRDPNDLEQLRQLLMKRAIKAIPIVLSLQNEGNSIERLYRRGMLTDDMHFKVHSLKEFVDQEFQDVQYEAEDLLEGWGEHIWPQAMQFYNLIQKQAGLTQPKDVDDDDDGTGKKKKKRAKPSAEKKAMSKEEKILMSAAAEGVPVEVIRAREAEKLARELLAEEEQESKKAGAKRQ
jgi:hypothetical protein